MTTDFRAELQALVGAYDEHGGNWLQHHEDALFAAVKRARAALAESEPEGPNDEELESVFDRHCFHDEGLGIVEFQYAARVVLARWGRPGPQLPAAGEVAELVAWLRENAMDEREISEAENRASLNLDRAANLLERLDRYDQALSAVMPSDFKDWWENSKDEWPDVAAGVIENLRKREELAWEQLDRLSPPQPVPVSERLQQIEDLAADAVGALRYIEQLHGRLYGVGWDRVYEKADRLRPFHALPQPVPVSERLPEPEDCDAEGRCWWFHDEDGALCSHWLPAHALPVPQ